MFGHATLQPGIAATVFPGTQTGVTANAASITEAMPVADLPIDHHAGESTKAAGLFRVGRGLQQIGRASLGKEGRTRWSPEHRREKQEKQEGDRAHSKRVESNAKVGG